MKMATEKRLIDANALKIHRMHNVGANHPLDVVYRKDIDNAPTVDAVEVVRCRDCARADLYSNRPCYLFCMEHHKLVEKDDFCSYGERKDNG
jgi:hypothetical protein